MVTVHIVPVRGLLWPLRLLDKIPYCTWWVHQEKPFKLVKVKLPNCWDNDAIVDLLNRIDSHVVDERN